MTRHASAADRARSTTSATLDASLASLITLIAEEAARNTLKTQS